MTLNPSRQPIAVTPADYGLEYEEVEFDSLEVLRLRGWFVPGDPRKVLLLTHPMYCNRHGFLVRNKSPLIGVKTDIELLLSVQALNKAGYSVLTFDFRNHGESEDGMTGVGLNECQDVLGALDYLQGRPDLEGAEFGLVAFCMGANATIIAMSRDPESFARARCLVAIQPISMPVFVRSYLRSTYTRLSLMVLPLMEGLRRWLGGHPLEEMSPGEYVKDIKVPHSTCRAGPIPGPSYRISRACTRRPKRRKSSGGWRRQNPAPRPTSTWASTRSVWWSSSTPTWPESLQRRYGSGGRDMKLPDTLSYLALWSVIGWALFSAYVVVMFRTGLAYTARNDDGTLKEQLPPSGQLNMLVLLVAIVGFQVGANYLGIASKGYAISFLSLFLLNFTHYLILFVYDTVFIDGFVLAVWRPDFLQIPEAMGGESMVRHMVQSLPIGLVAGVALSAFSTAISYSLWLGG
jgi:pimeloyl-ACP methyl ester carboxylesterase